MFYYDERGNKTQKTNKGYKPQKQVRFTNARENYGDKNGKCPKWLWYTLGGVGGVIVLALIIVLVRGWWKNRDHNDTEKSSKSSFGMGKKQQRFGFRFY